MRHRVIQETEPVRAFVLGNYMNANFLSVDRLPRAGESLAASGVFQEHGGKGLNLGVGLHRLGVTVHMVMAVGRDAAGEAVTQRLREEGMDARLILPLGAQSGYGVGFITPEGGNFLASFLGANVLLDTTHIDLGREALLNSQWVLAHYEVPDEVIVHAFTLARSRHVKTYLNPSPWRPPAAGLMGMTDVLVVNATEAARLTGEVEAESWSRAQWFAQLPRWARRTGWSGSLLVVTLAQDGCVALGGDGQMFSVPAYRIRQVDATGAGDAFGAGLLYGLMKGDTVDESLRLASACGALVAARTGILDGLATAAQLRAFMDSTPVY